MVDAPAQPDAGPVPDAPPDAAKRGFGESCTDKGQCESDICILVGTSGICTMTCGECPDGYGCVAVVGAIEQGEVSMVCVPSSDQLCTPCTQDSECTLLGMDKCLTEATGRTYCGRDCSSAGCPSGYACTDETINGAATKQCVPQTGACDCRTAAQAGTTDACTITTPLGTACAGAETCGGTAGWGACAPPSSTDTPDGNYADENCDGIDGDITNGIFVATPAHEGNDTANCGLTFDDPCETINFSIARAVMTGRTNLYIQAGSYTEVVVLIGGINLWGGYDTAWKRAPYSEPGHKVEVFGGADTGANGDGEYLTVRAHGLGGPVTIGDLVLHGPDASGVRGGGRDGKSSYVVHAVGSTVSLVRVQIAAGKGAAGIGGPGGLDWLTLTATSMMNGGRGGAGVQSIVFCDDTEHGAGGIAGVNSCTGSPSTRLPNGGAGGDGGTRDTRCNTQLDATPGKAGMNAATVLQPGNYGVGSSGGTGGTACGSVSFGNGGFILDGSGGSALGGGYLIGDYWYGHVGGPGFTGENGTGGGGGGGGGGCDNGTDAAGGGGGGGGAGGCAARGGGGGGGGGGGSIGVAAMAGAKLTLADCQLFRNAAGAGGDGGTGGQGQAGGASGQPGSHPGSGTPGLGWLGARGGHAGGGAGGQGGSSIGVLSASDATVVGTCTQSQGTAASGGAGGVSAPNAADHGGSGAHGGSGSVVEMLICSGTSC